MNKYEIEFTENFINSYNKIVKNNAKIVQRIDKAIRLLREQPHFPSLKTHKVTTRLYGERYSSRVTGDIRLIWDFDKNNHIVLTLLDIGGHSGKGRVYQ